MFYNAASTAAPPYALMAVVGTYQLPSGQIVPAIDQPSAAFHRHYLVNGARRWRPMTLDPFKTRKSSRSPTALAVLPWARGGDRCLASGLRQPDTRRHVWSCGVADANHGIMLARLHPIEWMVCELVVALEPSDPGKPSQASAAVCYRSPAGTFVKIAPEMDVTVVDRFSSWRGWPATTDQIASQCVAAFPNDEDKWTLVTMEPPVLHVDGRGRQ